MNNRFIKAQCENMIIMINTFKQSCDLAAKQDDGSVSKEEAKDLKRINKAADRMIDTLKRIVG